MIVWGTLWGALFGLLADRFDSEGLIFGAVLGALAGWTLRRSVDRRIAASLKGSPLAPGARDQVAAATPAAAPSTAKDRKAAAEAGAAATPRATGADAVPAAVNARETVPAQAAVPSAAKPAAEPRALDTPWVPTIPGRAPAAAAASMSATTARDAAVETSAAHAEFAAPSKLDTALAQFKAWMLGGNTVARLGALVFFVGLAFLARFAAERGLVPPELRLIGIAVVAIVLLVLGFRLRGTRTGYALTLQGAGVAILYLTIFAALRLYGFMPPLLAFALMVAVCALSAMLAVLQDARALAVIGAAGGFLAPILASTGQGDHVALFSYYTVLNLGILGVAWKKDWRLLNIVGFVSTFGIATAWGVLRYTPGHYASTQPFLILFVLIYTAIAMLFAWRRAPKATDYVDATLIFGTPLVASGLQAGLVRYFEYGLAVSSLAAAAFYLALAALLARRHLAQLRLLVECFLALGVVFLSLAVPFALDARWTAAAWALEGAAIVWIGLRQKRRLARAFGFLLQLGAMLAFADSLSWRAPQPLPLANAEFIGALLLALSAAACAWLLRDRLASEHQWDRLEQAMPAPLFLYGYLWWLGAVLLEITRRVPALDSVGTFAIAIDNQPFLFLAAAVVSATAACRFGMARDWAVATWPAHASLPLMLLFALAGSIAYRHLFEGLGWACWPIAIVAHLIALRWIDRRPPHGWFEALHAGGVWLLALLVASAGKSLIDAAELWATAWGPAAAVASASLVVAMVASASTSPRLCAAWPMARFARAYGAFGIAPIAALVFLGALGMTLTNRGHAAPLPHLPLLNPIDLSFLLMLAALWHWRSRLLAAAWELPRLVHGPGLLIVTGVALFVWINTVWLRVAHHFFGVRWDATALFNSFVVQAGYALLWTLIAVALMLFASRRSLRLPWLIGAGLLGMTVLKLMLIDLSNAGGGERIIAFIGVGALMLAVGYFAPLPPKPRVAVEAA